MFCFGVGVKDSPSFKISISSWVSGTFDKFRNLRGLRLRDRFISWRFSSIF